VKQLVILSGKGGTGKTAVTSAFAHLSHLDSDGPAAVFVDADVDAANLELLIGSSPLEEHEFVGGEIALIDPELCTLCGICQEVCRFDAVSFREDPGEYRIEPIGCEGCATCFYQCPEEAIAMLPRLSGHWFRSESRFGPLFHARLLPAQESSGKLVALVKEKARQTTQEGGYPLMLVDGPPGIACPAIAAVTGADMVLIVAEPTLAGVHDMERAELMTSHFRVETVVCVNKADLHPEGTRIIQEHCRTRGVRVLGSIPFDETVTGALVQGQPVTEYRPESPASRALGDLWKDVKGMLEAP
jgi:MinD superfamily P-loop ATPase